MHEKETNRVNILEIGAGSMFASMVIAGFIVGFLLDEWLDSAPFAMLICGLLGFVGGGLKVIEMVRFMDAQSAQQSVQAKQPKSTREIGS